MGRCLGAVLINLTITKGKLDIDCHVFVMITWNTAANNQAETLFKPPNGQETGQTEQEVAL